MADFKKCYAKVKYYNGDTEDISVRKIKTRAGDQFAPKDYKDFNSNILYSVKTAMNDVEGKEQRYYTYIGKLAESIDDLNQGKRISWPMWPSSLLEEPNNSSQEEGQDTPSSILTYRQKATLQKQKKRAAADDNYQKFLRNNTIEKVNYEVNNTLSDGTELAEHSKRNYLHTTTNLQLEELKNLLDDKLQKMEKKLFESINQQLKQANENIMSKMEEMLEKVCNLNDKQSDKTENKVHLGSNFYCTRTGFEAMKTAKNDCDWAVALLVGVFGDDAKLMRMYPRTEGLKKFPLGFLMLAQHLYRERLQEGNCEDDIDAMIKALPAYLADRALDLGGGRGKSRTKNFKKSKNTSQRMREEEAVAE